MNHVEALEARFPKALSTRRYLTRLRDNIEPLGFNRANTFTCTSVCRDELAQFLVEEATGFWQTPFSLGGLAGLPSGGTETWQAGLSHIPNNEDRGKLLVIAASHIGIGPDGTLGRIHRHGQADTTTACGALGAVSATIATTNGSPIDAALDTEAGRLIHALAGSVSSSDASDIGAFTIACATVINDSIWDDLESLAVHTSTDIVVSTGVQIHLHDDFDQFLPLHTAHKGADGQLTQISLC